MKVVKRVVENIEADFIRSKYVQLKERKATIHK